MNGSNLTRNSHRMRLLSFLALAVLLLSACQPAVSATPTPRPAPPVTSAPPITLAVPAQPTRRPAKATTSPAPSASPVPSLTPMRIARRVLILSIDGLRPDAISLAPMPNLQALMQSGAYSLTAQTIFPSVTLPAHASMLTGLCPAKHGVDWNDYLPKKGYAKGTGLFDLAHAAGLQTVMFVGKEKLRQITAPANTDIFRFINDRDTVIAQRITEEFPVDFGLMFVHFATPDDMGHVYGWMSPQYISVVQHSDIALGMLLKDLDDHGLRQETLIIVTADHGGHDQTHGTRQPEDMTIPWVINGPGVRPGQLTTPIQTTDTAATAAWALNLPRPADWDGWPVFEAFGQANQPRPVPFCK
jgi:arylsulfatase A-like enzyme